MSRLTVLRAALASESEKGATATTLWEPNSLLKGQSQDSRGTSLGVSLPMEHVKSGEVTFLGSHSKTGSRTHYRMSTPPVRLPKGSEARVKREANVHRS